MDQREGAAGQGTDTRAAAGKGAGTRASPRRGLKGTGARVAARKERGHGSIAAWSGREGGLVGKKNSNTGGPVQRRASLECTPEHVRKLAGRPNS